jgi:hypothetical protein
MLAPTVVAGHGYDLWLAPSTSCGSRGLIRWDIFAPQKIVSGKWLLPPPDCRAIFRRDVRTSRLRDDAASQCIESATLKIYQGDDTRSRQWALAVQLYAIRSHRNWNHGDFADLSGLLGKRTRRRLFRGEPLTNLRSISLSLTVSRTSVRRSAKTDPRPLVRRLFNHARGFCTCCHRLAAE